MAGVPINDDKCEYKDKSINLLCYSAYSVQEGELPEPHLQLGLARDTPSLYRTLMMLPHFSRWTPRFFFKICPLTRVKDFPLTKASETAFEAVKTEKAGSVVQAIDSSMGCLCTGNRPIMPRLPIMRNGAESYYTF